jgi:hypothetical protein
MPLFNYRHKRLLNALQIILVYKKLSLGLPSLWVFCASEYGFKFQFDRVIRRFKFAHREDGF